MMVKHEKTPRLSAGELEILQMLWRDGPVTISEARRGLGRRIGYTTVQTRLNRLVEKGIVTRTAERPANYQAAVAPEVVSLRLFVAVARAGQRGKDRSVGGPFDERPEAEPGRSRCSQKADR